MGKRWWLAGTLGVASLIVVGLGSYLVPGSARPIQAVADEVAVDAVRAAVVTDVIHPDPASALAAAAPQLSDADRESLLAKKYALRKQVAAATRSDLQGPPGLPEVVGQGTAVGGPASEITTPNGTFIGRNNRITSANGANASTLAEPAAANNGIHVLASGNFSHFEFSTNGGVAWTTGFFPAGPADAPIPCCDNDVIHDKGRGVTFNSTLYLNGARTNGVVRIFVRRNINAAPNCSYTFDPSAGSVLPDYPHLGLSNNHLYLTTNEISAGGAVAKVRRINVDQMADCLTASVSTASLTSGVGQRVVTPAEGAKETQYFSWAENSTQIRIWIWAQSAVGPISVLRNISSSAFTNPDCRGGTLNNDFTDSLWSSIHGFNRRGAVGKGRVYFYWNVGPDASHTQGHVHSAIFREGDLLLLAQTPMFINGNTQCNGLPMISTNDRGDLGISTAVGGRAGGGGTAARGFVGIADDFAGGIGFFPSITLVASGTHNRTDQRYGDYFTTHQHNPCGNNWTATSYALLNGTGVANVNSRYVEFGRRRDLGCWNEWQNHVPNFQP